MTVATTSSVENETAVPVCLLCGQPVPDRHATEPDVWGDVAHRLCQHEATHGCVEHGDGCAIRDSIECRVARVDAEACQEFVQP